MWGKKDMIRLYGHVSLTTKGNNVIIDKDTPEIADKLLFEMKEAGGIGLAANQIGLPHNMFVMMLEKGDTLVVINPIVLLLDQNTHLFPYDGCLSLPGVSSPTIRHNSVTLAYQDVHGESHKAVFEGLEAVIVQHEMDHLNGLLYIDHLGKLKREMLLKKYKKYTLSKSST